MKCSTLPIVLLFPASYFCEITRFFTFETFTKDSSRLFPTNFSHVTKNTTVCSGHIYSTLFLLFRDLSGGSLVGSCQPSPEASRHPPTMPASCPRRRCAEQVSEPKSSTEPRPALFHFLSSSGETSRVSGLCQQFDCYGRRMLLT